MQNKPIVIVGTRQASRVQLVDILRVINQQAPNSVVGRTWGVFSPIIYRADGSDESVTDSEWLLRGAFAKGPGPFLLEGEQLLERSALVSQVEEGLFFRVTDPGMPVKLTEHNYWNVDGHVVVNSDVEIRFDDFDVKVVTSDQAIRIALERDFVLADGT